MKAEIDGNKLRVMWNDEEGCFGNIDFYVAVDGRLKIITETMGKKFAKQILNLLVDEADLID